MENPGPDSLTVGLMLTWQDPAADPSGPAPAGAWHESIRTPEADGVVVHAPTGVPPGLRGTFAIAASRTTGVVVSARTRFDATTHTELWADFAADGRLDPSDDRRPTRYGEVDRRLWRHDHSGDLAALETTGRPVVRGRDGSR